VFEETPIHEITKLLERRRIGYRPQWRLAAAHASIDVGRVRLSTLDFSGRGEGTMQAKDVMTTKVISVSAEREVSEIAKLLIEKRISAVPVVDSDQRVLGIVSEGDLIRRAEIGTEKQRGSWWLGLFAEPDRLSTAYSKSHGRHASDVMTRDVITVTEDTSIADIAQSLEEKHIKRVPVVRDDRLVGIVSRANLLHGLAAAIREASPSANASDVAIRNQLLEKLKDEPWADMAYANATVEDGVVHLWGMAETNEQIRAMEVAARDTPGVTSVENHMGHFPPQMYWGE
jgi:CBS domain-containing protein